MQSNDRYWQAKRITLVGALMNALLGIGKLLTGIFFHSHALIADGLHSFSDLLTDAMVLFASKYGSQDADHKHPYGHQRIETAATLLLALILILTGTGIASDALLEIFRGTHTKPGWLTLPVAVLSVLINELLFHITRHAGNVIGSELIIANAWHHRSDAASSLVVVLGLAGSLLGFLYLDSVAAIAVGLLIIKMGVNYAWNSVKELIDTGVDSETLAAIKARIQRIDGVEKIHQLRSRLMGGSILIDVHILVNPLISVSEGHYIAQHVHRRLLQQFKRITDVTVHVDPEDDEDMCPSFNLPNRAYLEKHLFALWQEKAQNPLQICLHYLNGEIILDLIYDSTQIPTETLHKAIEETAPDILHACKIKSVRLLDSSPKMTPTH